MPNESTPPPGDRAAPAALAALDALQPDYAWAEQIPREDARIQASYVEYPSPRGSGTSRRRSRAPTRATSTAGENGLTT